MMKPKTPDNFLEPEYEPLYAAWKQKPTPAAGGALLKAVDPVVDQSLQAFTGGQAASPLLKGRARRMVLEALPSYDPSKAKLKTFLTGRLQGLRRHAAEAGVVIPVPEQVRLDKIHLERAARELSDELGREPDDLELADHVNLPLKRIAHVRLGRPETAEGMLKAPGESGRSEEFQVPVESDAGADAWQEFVYYSLTDPTDRLVMEHSLGMNGRPVVEGLALAKRLRLSPSAVSQRKAKLQALLDNREAAGVF